MENLDVSVTSLSRRRLLRNTAGGIAAVGLAPLLAACGDDKDSSGSSKAGLDAVRDRGVARVGLASVAPYCYLDGDKAVGYVADEIAAVFKGLGVDKIEPVTVDFAGIIPGLQAGRFDVSAVALYITKERCGQVLFANPDVASFESFAVKSGNPEAITDYDSLAASGAKAGFLSGSQEIQFAVDAGVDQGSISEFPDIASALDALKTGRVAAVGYDSGTIGYELSTSNYSSLEMPDPFTVPADANPTYSGMALSSKAGDLRDAVNGELKKLQDSGDLVNMATKYGLPDVAVTACYGKSLADAGC